mgnify:FL=1
MPKKKKPMQWEVRDLPDGRWGIFLKQEFCRTDEPVCYGACRTLRGAKRSVERLNNDAIAELSES